MTGSSSVLDRARELENEEEPARNREVGAVKNWNPQKGFGFARLPSGIDVFIHVSALRSASVAGLEAGQRISFLLRPALNGMRDEAIDVRLLDAEPPEPEGADEEAEARRNRRSAVSNARRPEWIEQTRPATAPRPRLPTDGPLVIGIDPATLRAPEPAAAGAWAAYLAARERAGDNHPAVVRLDIAWGSQSQAAASPERWAELAAFFMGR